MSEPSPGLAIAWRIAASEAGAAGYTKIECAHLMMGLLSLDKANPKALKDLGFDPALMSRVAAEEAAIRKLFDPLALSTKVLRRDLRSRVKKRPVRAKGVMSRSAASKVAFEKAQHLAGTAPINALHLMAVLLREPDPVIGALVADRRLGSDLVDRALAAAARSFPTAPTRRTPTSKIARPRETKALHSAQAEGALVRFGRDLSGQARRGEIGPVVGRRKEIAAVLQALARSTSTNPLLVGEAGVGKTAIVEAVALRGAAGKDPVLVGKRIVELNVGALLAGTEVRGEFEKRMKELLAELRATPGVLLFINDIHLVVGAGRAGSGVEAGSLLTPALARAEVQVIGATTLKAFRDSIEKDSALERRFERIDVAEPSISETLEILKGIKEVFEKRHVLAISEDALEAAVQLSVRFDTDHRLPDKAVDLVARAAARSQTPTVDARGIAEALAEKRGLPIEVVTDGAGEGARLLKLEAQLKSKIVGQDAAVAAVAARIKLAHTGASGKSGPLAVFLLLGPTGVGKTETARSLARFLFSGPDDLSRFDMADYADEQSVARLTGASGALTEAIRTRPRSVILFDEVEKAHPKAFDLLLTLFETGSLTDAQGRAADARQAIVVMTSSVGNKASTTKPAMPSVAETVPFTRTGRQKAELRQLFRPELLSRIDDVISFRALDEGDVKRIARPILAALITRVRKTHGVLVRFEPEAETFVLRAGMDAEKGIRELKDVIERLVDIPLAKLAVTGKLAQHPEWKAVHEGGGLYFLPE